MIQAELERTLLRFEGLVTKTAHQIVESGAELEFEDIAQLLRVKVWHAVQRFDEKRVGGTGSRPRGRNNRSPLDRFVFGCVRNLRRDIEKRPRRYIDSIDELRCDPRERDGYANPRADYFDARYLSVSDEDVFAFLRDELDLPEDLTKVERQVVMLRLEGKHLLQIDRALGLSRAQRERVMQSLRAKLSHLDPSRGRDSAVIEALPLVAPPATRSPGALAA